MIIPLSELSRELMEAASHKLMSLTEKTSKFTKVSRGHFEDPLSASLLMAGKKLKSTGDCDADHSIWTKSDTKFSPNNAARDHVIEHMLAHAKRIVDHVYDETESLTCLTPEWIMANPFCLQALVNATGDLAVTDFRAHFSINNSSDRSIGRTDAYRLFDIVMSSSLKPRDKTLSSLYRTVEGIVRDRNGRMLSEAFVRRELVSRGLDFVEDKGGRTQVVGMFSSSRADFCLPDNNAPRVIIEVKSADKRHGSVYGEAVNFRAIDRGPMHPDCVNIFIYDKEWPEQVLENARKLYDYVLPMRDCALAALIAQKHLSGINMKRRIIRVAVDEVEPEISLDDLL